MDFENARISIVRGYPVAEAKVAQGDRYLSSYRALRNLADVTDDDPRNDGLLALTSAVYGWMPTILGGCDFERFNCDGSIINTIKEVNSPEDAVAFIKNMELIAPINGTSWVGTSKLLHFLNPLMFPIWDKRVARHFGLSHHGALNKRSRYAEYLLFVHQEAEQRLESMNLLADQIQNRYQVRPSLIRCVELCLFECSET